MIRLAVVGLLAGCLAEPDHPCAPARLLEVNTDGTDQTPWLSADRNELIFTSLRSGNPKFALYRATRQDPSKSFSPPVMFSDGTTVDTFDPFVLGETLYFIEGSGTGGGAIHAIPRNPAGDFGPIVANMAKTEVFQELHTVLHPTLTADASTIVFADPASMQLMMSTRLDVMGPFPAAHRIGYATGMNGGPSISPDGQTLVFDTGRFAGGTRDQIARGRRSGDDFVDITHLDLGGTQDNDVNPYLHPDGRTLVFASDRANHNTKHVYIYCE